MNRTTPVTKIFLVGFMASGKSTFGRRLADSLGWELVDLDAVIETEEGVSIASIFTERGEPAFRVIEREHLSRLAASPGRAVVACGGGAFCSEENRTVMHRHGVSVWLDRPIERILENRDELARGRPLMSDEATVRRLYEERRAYYAAADYRVAVAENGIDGAADDLLARLAGHLRAS